MQINELELDHVGKYACYVFSSTGTMKHIFEIKQTDQEKLRVFKHKPNKKINLSIEYNESIQNIKDVKYGESYEFDCVTGIYFKIQNLFKKIFQFFLIDKIQYGQSNGTK